MTQDLSQSALSAPEFMAFSKCFCINPVFVNPVSGGGHYKKRKGWVLIDLATRVETNFKTLRDARHHLMCLYMETTPPIVPAAGI